MTQDLTARIFSLNNDTGFLETALEIFRYQSQNNPLYSEFTGRPGIKKKTVDDLTSLPFLPAEFFRNFRVFTENRKHELVFESSGTTGSLKSRHFVADPSIYRKSFRKSFNLFYGDPSDYCIAALLPSYVERQNSSLVYMMNDLIRLTGTPLSGFFKDDFRELLATIAKARKTERRIMLMGVSFALLDFAGEYSPDLSDVIVMETGGMKGKRKELTRDELHSILKEKFNAGVIHSEYGMTELLSQAYSKGEGIFHCPPWMKIIIRDPHDPLSLTMEPGITGAINVIDLANVYSCSFIATDDLGKLREDGGFEVLGRIDDSDIRGCNLLIE